MSCSRLNTPSNHDETRPNDYASATWRPGQLLGKVQEKGPRRSHQQPWFAMSFKGVEGNDSIAWRLRQAYHDELLHSEASNYTTDSRLGLIMMIEKTLAKIMYMAH
jgi:hypothetical protein